MKSNIKNVETIKKYDIWLVNLNPTKGSEQSGIRPYLVIQNNLFFENQSTTIVLPITSQKKSDGNFKILLEDFKSFGLDKQSTILSFQIRTVDKSGFFKKLGNIIDKNLRKKIKNSLILSLDLDDEFEE